MKEGKKINQIVNPKLGKGQGRAKALKGKQNSIEEEDGDTKSSGNAAKKKQQGKKKNK